MARRPTPPVVCEVRPARRCRRRAADASSSQVDSEMEHTMDLGAMIAAESTSWPEAAIAIAGIALVASVAVVAVWQALATWRTRIAVTREGAYRKLAEQTERELREIDGRLNSREQVGERGGR